MPEWDPTPYRDKLNGFAGCVLCQDCGWHAIGGSPQWCQCEAGSARRVQQPNTLDAAIETQRRLFLKFPELK